VTKGHVVGLLVFGKLSQCTCVSFRGSLNLGEEFLAGGVHFVEDFSPRDRALETGRLKLGAS